MAAIGEKERQQRAMMEARSKPAAKQDRRLVAPTITTAAPIDDGHHKSPRPPSPLAYAPDLAAYLMAEFGATTDEIRDALADRRQRREKSRSAMAALRARKKEVTT